MSFYIVIKVHLGSQQNYGPDFCSGLPDLGAILKKHRLEWYKCYRSDQWVELFLQIYTIALSNNLIPSQTYTSKTFHLIPKHTEVVPRY